jgi:hypothetical protein
MVVVARHIEETPELYFNIPVQRTVGIVSEGIRVKLAEWPPMFGMRIRREKSVNA